MKMSFPHVSIRWAFNVSDWKPTLEQWKLAVQCVQKEEMERCYRFAFIDDCKSSMVGQLLMRKAASEVLCLPYDTIRFFRTSSGKPCIESNKSFSFNISHHGDFCVLAAETDFLVGTDVMRVEHRGNRSVTEFFNTMKKQFSSSEWDFISQPGLEKEQLARFYRLWCLKESYVKAIGTGIAFDLKSLSFSCPTVMLQEKVITSDTLLHKEGILQDDWRFEETFLDVEHCVAVALKPIEETNIEECKKPNCYSFLSFEDLSKMCKPFEMVEENSWKNFQLKKVKET